LAEGHHGDQEGGHHEHEIVTLTPREVAAVVEPGDLGQVVERPEQDVGEQEGLERPSDLVSLSRCPGRHQ
jgi:hypothetical protein